jgi:hypothetical protein
MWSWMMSRFRALRGWWRESATFLRAHPGALFGVVSAGLLGGGLGVPVGDSTYRYMWADDRFCNDCHVHDYANEAFERSIHHGMTTCHDCHLVPIRHYPRNLVVTLFDPPQGPEDIHAPEVETVICVRCHSAQASEETITGPMPPDVRAQVVKIDASPGHRRHLSAKRRDPLSDAPYTPEAENWVESHGTHPDWYAGTIQCVDCHGAENNRAHRFEASAENCIRCHETELPHLSPSGSDAHAALDCRSCHFAEFLSPLDLPDR